MDVKFALLADHVTETREGKLVIVGEFDTIGAPRAPVTHAPMYLVARLEAADAAQDDLAPGFQLGLYNAAGEEVVPLSPANPLNIVRTGDGRRRGQVIIQLGGVQFPDFGTYTFRLVVDGHVLAQVPVHVIQIDRQRSTSSQVH